MFGVSDGRSWVKVASRLYRPYSEPAAWDFSYYPFSYRYGADDLFFVDGDFSHFISDELPLSSIVGIRQHKEELIGSNQHFTRRPSTTPWSGELDFQRYGNIISSLRVRGDEPNARFEQKNVEHVKFVGSLGDDSFTSLYGLVDHYVGRYGYSQNRWNNPYPYNRAIATGVTDGGYLSFSVGPDSPSVDRVPVYADAYQLATSSVEYYKSLGSIAKNTGLWSWIYSDFESHCYSEYNFRHIDISYSVLMAWAVPYVGMKYHANVRVHLDFDVWWSQDGYGNNLAFEWNRISPSIFHYIDRSSIVFEEYNGIFDEPGYSPTPISTDSSFNFHELVYDNDPSFATLQLQVGDEFSGRLASFISLNTGDPHRLEDTVKGLVTKNMPHIRPSSFLAASKALDDNATILKTNQLQNLQHLPGILGLLPDLPKIAKAVVKAAEGDPAAIIYLIDIVTEEILKWRFQRDPAARSVDEISNANIDESLRALHQRTAATIRGSFRYVFTDAENFLNDGILTLETHATIRVKFDLSTFMMGVFDANSLGLLPTLSRIWNLLPFSFVVDWFTNMAKRLHMVDNQLLYTTLGISWCLWSYKITYYPSPSRLGEFDLINPVVSRPFGISVYCREFSTLMPRLSESKFDFLRPTTSPDPVTVGALLCQLII